MDIVAQNPKLKEDCSLLNNLDQKCMWKRLFTFLKKRFCQVAVSSIVEGIDNDALLSLAESLKQEPEAIQKIIRALAEIFTVSASSGVEPISDSGFNQFAEMVGLNAQAYVEVHIKLREILKQFEIQVPSYRKLDWRLDVQLASRASQRRVDPVFLCQLEIASKTPPSVTDIKTDDNGNVSHAGHTKSEKILFESDFANIENMISELEQALEETHQTKLFFFFLGFFVGGANFDLVINYYSKHKIIFCAKK
ncbi:hypothetical protein RFI_03923 [Reticulomyxa filosa]|uniref:COMM domain-containing protein n=1 Tax=Reticulomyxa filosa TaxID=46433 RepID=X6P519_RETFI|nr:hypothetical protein RFI_03923 [Reticulomyxa filosa]|eukprot:ETO33184.1 hypothetical protein RFI_03923 [Reticulomyxa filosa]